MVQNMEQVVLSFVTWFLKKHKMMSIQISRKQKEFFWTRSKLWNLINKTFMVHTSSFHHWKESFLKFVRSILSSSITLKCKKDWLLYKMKSNNLKISENSYNWSKKILIRTWPLKLIYYTKVMIIICVRKKIILTKNTIFQ